MSQRQLRSRIAFRNRCPQELGRGGAVAAAAYSVEVLLSDIQICRAIGIIRLRAFRLPFVLKPFLPERTSPRGVKFAK